MEATWYQIISIKYSINQPVNSLLIKWRITVTTAQRNETNYSTKISQHNCSAKITVF